MISNINGACVIGSYCSWLSIAIMVMILLICPNISYATDDYEDVVTISLGHIFKTKSKWFVTAKQLKQTDNSFFETSQLPAKICFSKSTPSTDEQCYQMSNGSSIEAVDIDNALNSNDKLIMFLTKQHGETILNRYEVSVFSYQQNNDKFTKVTPKIIIGATGEYKLMAMSDERYLVISKEILNIPYETLTSKHAYEVEIYKQSLNKEFHLKHKYKTSLKYNDNDNSYAIGVIDSEYLNIVKHIKSKTKQ